MPKKYRTPPPTAQGATDKEPRAWNPRERYMLFARGYGDGACFKAMAHDGHCDYVAGYREGQLARGKAVRRFGDAIGYKPEILRLADES